MSILTKNTNIDSENYETNIISGIESIFAKANYNGIKNLFYDEKLNQYLPEIFKNPLIKSYSNTTSMWYSIYALSLSNQRSFAVCDTKSFFYFSQNENLFLKTDQLNGGILVFIFNNGNSLNLHSEIEKKFPIYNYFQIDNFLDSLPAKFELSEKIKLPVLIYLNDSILYEYKINEKAKYSERIEAKPVLRSGQNNNDSININLSSPLNKNLIYFKNIDKSVEFFKGNDSHDLILCDSKNFPHIIEKFDKPDIVLFELINPIDTDKLNNIIDEFCQNYYENIYLYDGYNLLSSQLYLFFKENKKLGYGKIRIGGTELNGFCIENFTPAEMPVPATFCMGCNIFTFLQKFNKQNIKDITIIGDKSCFPLLTSSSLKYSFTDIFITEEPIYFISNLNIKELNKHIYVFVSYSNFSDKIEYIIEKIKNLTPKEKINFIVYNSIYDLHTNPKIDIKNPLVKSFKTEILKGDIRINEIKDKIKSHLIFIENDCEKKSKNIKNYNYSKYLLINNDICKKFECKLCFQTTKCPAIKININNIVAIDPVVCVDCKLCVDLCPHKGIKRIRRKKVKIKESIESKINLN